MFDSNEVINGTNGFLYDETGKEVQGTQEFEAVVEFQKAPVKQAGKFMESTKVIGGKGTGSIKLLKLDTRLQKKVLANPTQKFNYVGKLADPSTKGGQYESVTIKGVSFSKVPITKWKVGELVENDFEFDFDDYAYNNTIE